MLLQPPQAPCTPVYACMRACMCVCRQFTDRPCTALKTCDPAATRCRGLPGRYPRVKAAWPGILGSCRAGYNSCKVTCAVCVFVCGGCCMARVLQCLLGCCTPVNTLSSTNRPCTALVSSCTSWTACVFMQQPHHAPPISTHASCMCACAMRIVLLANKYCTSKRMHAQTKCSRRHCCCWVWTHLATPNCLRCQRVGSQSHLQQASSKHSGVSGSSGVSVDMQG